MMATSRARVVALLGNDTQHKNTLSTLLRCNVNVVGACLANQKKAGIPISYIFRSMQKRGSLTTFSQIIARILYLIRNRKLDRKLKDKIFDKKIISETLDKAKVTLLKVVEYDELQALNFISELKPDILIIHTGAWVGKKVREIPGVKYVIGGHPGITPYYRGSHSPFWAIMQNNSHQIGWTCFLLDSGVDTGPVIEQGYLEPDLEETYMSLSWRGMVKISESQVRAIRKYENSGKINAKIHKTIPEGSEFFVPTVSQQLRYWVIQQRVL